MERKRRSEWTGRTKRLYYVSALIFLVSPPDPTTRRHCGLRFAVKRLSFTAQDDGEAHGMNLNIRSRFSEEFKIADKHESAI